MAKVHFSGLNNSTPFTDCCGVAAIDEKNCPECGEEIDSAPENRFKQCMQNRRAPTLTIEARMLRREVRTFRDL